MKKIISSLIILIIMCNMFAPMAIANSDTSEVVTFGDNRLKQYFINYGADMNCDGNLTINELNNMILTGVYLYENITSLSGIQYVTSLTKVCLYNLENDLDFSYLSKLPNLTELEVSGRITNITSLQGTKQLKRLYINSYSNEGNLDMQILKNFSDLENLSMSGKFHNMQAIENLTKLKQLTVCYNNYSAVTAEEGIDLNTIGKLKSLEKLEITNTINIDIAPLIKLTNLKELSLNLGYKIDISAIGQLTNLEKLNLHNVAKEISTLEKLTKLKELSIFFTDEIEVKPIENLSNLEKLTLNNVYSEMPNLSKLSKLKELTVNASNFHECKTLSNMDKIKILSSVENLSLGGHLEDISGLEKMPNLKTLTLSNQFYTYENEYNLKEQNFIETINKLRINDVTVTGTYNIELGSILCGETKEIKFEDLSPIIKSLMTKGDKLYNSNLELSRRNMYGDQTAGNTTIDIDNVNKKLKITANEFGEYYVYLETTNRSTGFRGDFAIKWKNTALGDTTKEIQFADENLKQALLKNYDINEDKKITEHDMINYINLDLSDKNIKNISGIEKAINLVQLDLANNQISNIAPVENLEKLLTLNVDNNIITDASPLRKILKAQCQIMMQNNYLEDVTCLEGCDFNMIDLKGNYIDFSEGTQNRKTVEKSIEEVLKENYVQFGITDMTLEEYVEINKPLEIDCIISTWYYLYEKYGSVAERNDEVEFEKNLKQALIKAGVDKNNDGKLTKGELNDFGIEKQYEQEVLDLSNLNITNIEGLKYLSNIEKVDLSNNNISDISPLKECRTITHIDLSNNNISDITILSEMYSVYNMNLSNNNISNIDYLKNLRAKDVLMGHGGYWSGGGGPDRFAYLDFSNNKITDISVINEFKTLKYANLSNNLVTDISFLKDYNFVIESGEKLLELFEGIYLSENYIDVKEKNNKEAISVFEENGIVLELNDQKEIGDIDGDATITSFDAFKVLEESISCIFADISEPVKKALDIDKDGTVTSFDAYKLLEYSVGIIDKNYWK